MGVDFSLTNFFENIIDFTSGCTEPAAIAYNSSIAGDYLQKDASNIKIKIDNLTYKNAFRVKIPNSDGKKGTKWAFLFGFLISEPSLKLEIFNLLDEKKIEKAKKLKDKIEIEIENIDKPHLYIETVAKNKKKKIRVITKTDHTNTAVFLNGEIDKDFDRKIEDNGKNIPEKWFDYRNWESMINKVYSNKKLLEKFKKGAEFNLNAAKEGKKYIHNTDDYGVSGAVYSRMNGDSIPVMSCAKSGNKGLTSIIPVIKKGEKLNVSEEKKIKAGILSYMVSGLFSAKFGNISSICGCIYAAGCGIIAGSLYLEDRINLFFDCYKNYMASVAGIFCDGAKGGCAMKTSNTVLFADKAIEYVEKNFIISPEDGYLGKNLIETIENLKSYNKYFKLFDKNTIEILEKKKKKVDKCK